MQKRRKRMVLCSFALALILFQGTRITVQAEENGQNAVPVRTDRIEVTAKTEEEVQQVIQYAVQSHTEEVRLKGGRASYQALCTAVSGELHAPLHGYEGATIYQVKVAQQGKDCLAGLNRMSTIGEEEAVDAAVAQYIPVLQGMQTRDQVVTVHDFICNQVSYSYETVYGAADYRSAYDGLASGQGVCTTYALLFQKFMDQLGIPCYVATGNVNGTSHAWNIVCVDGAWYHVDCTWDDQPYGILHQWCLVGADRAGYPSWGGIVLAQNSLD